MLGGEDRGRVRIQAAVVARDRHRDGAGERERLQRGEVGRLLHEHPVTRLEQSSGDECEGLLRAARHKQVVRLSRKPARRQLVRERRPQCRVALGRRVLKRAPSAPVRQDRGERVAQPGRVEQLGGRQATGERDHAGTRGEGQDLPHRRAPHPTQASGDGRKSGGWGDCGQRCSS
jgi:hypothetical protein